MRTAGLAAIAFQITENRTHTTTISVPSCISNESVSHPQQYQITPDL